MRPRILQPTLALGLSALLAAAAARAQTVTLSGKNLTLTQVLAQLERSTGYEFIPQGLAPDVANTPREVELRDLPVPEALSVLGATFKCDFFSLEPTGFRVLPLRTEEEKGVEITAGEYRIRLQEPTANVQPINSLLLPVTVSAPTEEKIERIAYFGPELKVTDNFGRALYSQSAPPARGTQAARTRLLDYFQRFELSLPDTRSSRIRTFRGTLTLYRKVVPIRVEFPLEASSAPSAAQEREGVTIALDKGLWSGRTFLATTRVEWPDGVEVVNRGLYRTPMPYVVDSKGDLHRPTTPRSSHSREGARRVTEQTLKFQELPERPQKLVYELWVKSDASERVPFRAGPIPLPASATPGPDPEQRPLYDPKGGSLVLKVVGLGGKPLEGEVTLGLVRKTGGGGTRWLDVSTDPEGVARLEQLAPGAYRVTRLFRTAPGARAIGDGKAAVEVVVTAGKSVSLPPLRLKLAPPED